MAVWITVGVPEWIAQPPGTRGHFVFAQYEWPGAATHARCTMWKSMWKDFYRDYILDSYDYTMQSIDQLNRNEWLAVLIVVTIMGAFCMRGFGSRSNY